MDPSFDTPPEIGVQRLMGSERYHGKVGSRRSHVTRRGDPRPPEGGAGVAGYGLSGPRPGGVWTAVRGSHHPNPTHLTGDGRSRTPSELRYQRTSTSGSQPSLDLAEVEADAFRKDEQDVVNLNIDIFVQHDALRDSLEGEDQRPSSDDSRQHNQENLGLNLPVDTSLPPTERLDAMLGVGPPGSPQRPPRNKPNSRLPQMDMGSDGKETTGHVLDGLSRILWAAVVKGNLEAVRSVYKERRVLYVDHHGNTALHLAAKLGQSAILKWLLRCSGVRVTMRNSRGETCSHVAAKHGHVDCLRLIVFCGSVRPAVLTGDGDRQGLTPAHLAAILGHAHIVRWLVNTFGIPIATARNNLGQTPLHFAAAKGCLKSTEVLSRLGDEVINAQDEVGCTPVYYACQEGQVLTLRHLVDVAGASVSMATNEGLTPLQAAAQTGRVDIVHFLLQRGRGDAHLATQTKDGATVFHMAAANGQADTLALLLRHPGADVAARLRDIKGSSCAHDAAENGHVECLKLLYTAGLDMHQPDEDGETPCTLAAQSSNRDCTRLSEEMEKQRPVVVPTTTVSTTDHHSDSHTDSDSDIEIEHLHDLDGARLMWLIERQAAKFQRRKPDATNFVREDTMRSKEKKSLFRRLKDKFDEEKQLQDAYERNLKVLKKEFILRSKQARADNQEKSEKRHLHKPTPMKAGQSVLLKPKPIRMDTTSSNAKGGREDISLQRTDVLPEGTSRSLRRMASQVRQDALSDEHHLTCVLEASSRLAAASRPHLQAMLSDGHAPKINPVIQELKRTLQNSHGQKYDGKLRSAENEIEEIDHPNQSTVTTQTYASLEHVFLEPTNPSKKAQTNQQTPHSLERVTSPVQNKFVAGDNAQTLRTSGQIRSPEDHQVQQGDSHALRPVLYPGPKVPPRRSHKLKKLGDYRPLKDKVSMQFECIPEVDSNSSSSFSERHSNHSSFEKSLYEHESNIQISDIVDQSFDYHRIPDYCPPPPSFQDDMHLVHNVHRENQSPRHSLQEQKPQLYCQRSDSEPEKNNSIEIEHQDLAAGSQTANPQTKGPSPLNGPARRSEEHVTKKIHPRINVLRNILQDSGIMTAYMDYMQGKFNHNERKSEVQDRVAAAAMEPSGSVDGSESKNNKLNSQAGVPPAPPPPPVPSQPGQTGKTANIANTEDDMSVSPANSSQTSGYISPGTPPAIKREAKLTSGQLQDGEEVEVTDGRRTSPNNDDHQTKATPFQEIRHLQGQQSPWNVSLRRPPPRGATRNPMSELERFFKLRSQNTKLQ